MIQTVHSYFSGIIGQEKTKEKLGFYLGGYKVTDIFPNLILIAPRGCGKTIIARKIAANLIQKDTHLPKNLIEINCSALKNTRQWINQVVIPYVENRSVTILFDEASEIPKDLTMALLTILNPNPQKQNRFRFEDFVYHFDFRKHSFLFATTEAQKIFHALMDRLERIELEDYTTKDLANIVNLSLASYDRHFNIEDSILSELSQTLRGNARAAEKMGEKIGIFLKQTGLKTFGESQWWLLKKTLGIFPLGLSEIELRVLKILASRKNRGFSLTQLSSMTDMTKSSLMNDIERFLLRHSFLEINTNGRQITDKGLEYLEELKRW